MHRASDNRYGKSALCLGRNRGKIPGGFMAWVEVQSFYACALGRVFDDGIPHERRAGMIELPTFSLYILLFS